MLLHFCHIGCNNLNKVDTHTAFCNMLNDILVPLHTRLQSGSVQPRGSEGEDPLVADSRILLLLQAYLPNFWRVFLYYVQIVQQHMDHVVSVDCEYPAAAQHSEAVGSRQRVADATTGGVKSTPLFMTESSLLSCVEDFGLSPSLCSPHA